MTTVYIAEGTHKEGTLSVFKEFTGLTAKEIRILALLTHNNRLGIADLAGITGFDYTTIKEILENLKAKGLVKSTPEKPVCIEWVPSTGLVGGLMVSASEVA